MEDISLKNVNVIHHKPHKMNPTVKSVWSGFKDFASSSNLHGLKYFSEKISIFEKIFWAVTFIASIGLCALLINNVWYKWQTSPVIVTINEEVIPVWKVPFPAITICPQIKCKQTVYNYTEALINNIADNNDTEDSKKSFLDDITTVCGEEDLSYSFRDISNASLVHNIWSVAPKIDEVFVDCNWREDMVDCKEIFKEVLTKEGLCFTFNTQNVADMFNMDSIQRDYIYLNEQTETKEWSMETGYTGDDVKQAYPRIGRQNGAQPDLRVILKENQTEKDNMCNSLNHGFKVYMHHPTDMPQSSLYYYAVLPNQLTALATKFNMVSTSNTLKDYPPETRQCYFPSDRKLKYFKVYTQSNCELECLSNYTYNACKCVWFHMPHENSSRICGNDNLDCVVKAKEDLSYHEMIIGKAKSKTCNCLPACDSVSYDAEVLKTAYNYKILANSFFSNVFKESTEEINNMIEGAEFSSLVIYFKESRFVSMRRSELFGTTDFLANCGGLLGLFLGFSFLSIIEIIYFLITRVLCKIWRRNNKTESTPTNQTEKDTSVH